MGFSLTPMVRMLLLLNVGIFIMQQIMPVISDLGALYTPGFSPDFQPWQFISYLFLHGGIRHIFGNMFSLIIFGPRLEQFWGPQRFLFFYLFTGIGAGVLHTGVTYYELTQLQADTYTYVQNPSSEAFTRYMNDHAKAYYNQLYEFTSQYDENPENPQYIQQSQSIVSDYYQSRQNVPTVGASGAVFGILMAFALLFPNTELFLLFFPFPIKAKYFVGMYGIYELFGGIQQAPGDSIAHFAHLGGMFFAFILIKFWGSQRDKFY